MTVETLSKILKDAREAKGLSQMDVAKKVGVAYMTYFLWEKGLTQTPKPENLRKLEEVLGIVL